MVRRDRRKAAAADSSDDRALRLDTAAGLFVVGGADDVLLAAAEGARRDVLDADFLPLYRTVELAPPAPDADLAVLMSGSAARALAATGARIPVVAIGPQTAAAAREAGLEVVAEARTHDLDGLADAVNSIQGETR